MKKFLALLLALVLCCGLACAYADVLEADDLVGNWYAEDEELIPFVLTLNSDQTFEAVIDADLPIEENHIEGTWEFDGAAILSYGLNLALFGENYEALEGLMR